MIGELYGIEASIRGRPADERLRVRQQKSKPLLGTIETWMKATLAKLSKKSETAKAINYSLNQWNALTLYCEDGRVEISNVLAENALRCVALGRKNFGSSAESVGELLCAASQVKPGSDTDRACGMLHQRNPVRTRIYPAR
jgi:hypothetical protein